MNITVYTKYEYHCIHKVLISLYAQSMNITVYTKYEYRCIHTV